MPRGKTLGGSSSINGMAHIYGQPSDYDHWSQLGNTGWSWDHVKSLFKQTEDHWRDQDNDHGQGDGASVTNAANRLPERSSISRATRAFIDGATASGLPFNEDFNFEAQEGVGWIDHNITRRGRRHSSAKAVLDPARHRKNLEIVTDALAQRIVFEGKRASGVRVQLPESVQTFTARKEIILCSGLVNSRQLLMLSGICPAETLSKFGIEAVHANENVGEHLQDHTYVH